ncbi:ferredoxin [Streptomyces sp. NPDC003077]|uniref:ferredoxin n=1 Tax=Streptomyces sp. NPDC003077 TaxID=3154443 RepID=UPI0033B5F891
MRVDVESDKCIASGVCVLAAPEVFDQNEDDGIVVVLDDRPAAERHEAVRDAAMRCPAAVIQLREEAGEAEEAEEAGEAGEAGRA